jgi:hypothetical protein
MPSRAGSPNKKTLRLQELSEKYGVDPVEMQYIIMADLKKSVDNELGRPRSRRSKRYFEAEAKLCEVAKEVAPYVHSRRAAVTTVDETPRITVIRSPEKLSDLQVWLAKFGPQRDEMANERPPAASEAVERLQATYKIAEAIGVDSASAVIKQVASRDEPNAEFTAALNRKMLRHYD